MPAHITDQPNVQSAVVLALIGRSRTMNDLELYAAVTDAPPRTIDAAVTVLIGVGVVARSTHGALSASAATKHLDVLGLIAI
jgi:hypothetical protein